jgi:hypothetical protein
MWLVLRILTLVGVYLWKFFWRQQGVQSSGPYRDTLRVKKEVRGKRGSFVKDYRGLEYSGPLRFQITEEGGLDGFFKGLGLAVEQQTDDPAFDRNFYLTCDQPALGEILRQHDDARTAVQHLSGAGAKRIFTDGANLWAELDVEHYDKNAVLEDLYTLRAALRKVDPASHRSRLDAFFWKALAVESLAWSIACYGIPGFAELAWHRNTLYPDAATIFAKGLMYSMAVFALLFGLILLLLRGSSRGHRIIIEGFVVLAVGVPLSTVQALSDANINLDHHPARITEHEVTGKYIRTVRGRRGRKSYYYHLQLRAQDNSALAGKSDLQVEYSIYNSVPERGGRIEVVSHPGWAGFPWIEAIRPK